MENRRSKQMMWDVLDLHEMLETMRLESKRVSCQILKDRERVRRQPPQATVIRPYWDFLCAYLSWSFTDHYAQAAIPAAKGENPAWSSFGSWTYSL